MMLECGVAPVEPGLLPTLPPLHVTGNELVGLRKAFAPCLDPRGQRIGAGIEAGDAMRKRPQIMEGCSLHTEKVEAERRVCVPVEPA